MTGAADRAPPARAGSGKGSLLVTLIATFFGSGLSPVSPGTCGTLATVPLAYLLMSLGRPYLYVATVALLAIGTWAAGRYCEMIGKHDSGHVVIDETVGYLICLWPVNLSALNLAAAFGLFRLFDIWKPWPIRVVDRRVKGGFGVMADDVCAGVVSAVILWLLEPHLARLPELLR